MKNKSLVEMIDAIDTSYLTEQERIEAIARAQASEYTAELIHAAFSWVKKALVSKRITVSAVKHSHA